MDSLSSLFRVNHIVLTYVLVVCFFYNPAHSTVVVHLTDQNFDTIIATKELVLINFYADWCRFSNMLQPIFEEAAESVKALYSEEVVLGKVDCDKESAIASRFHITKYPTLKLVRNGQPAKREYRGQRSAEAFVTFIKTQMEDPVKEFQSITELLSLDSNKRIIIGYFDRRDQPQYNIFRRAAMNLKEDCQFHAGFEAASQQMHPPGEPIVVFRPDKDKSNENDETYLGSLSNFDELHVWASEKCTPLVREITFENAEELTEEGLPFLILFHSSNDKESIKKFRDFVASELISEKQNINFLIADGAKFAHPLHHLGKSDSDLPVIAIDSFRHMYLFSSFDDMSVPGKMKEFIADLYSGKLHREYHYGTEVNQIIDGTDGEKTPPPKSTFKELLPSRNRYTLRDEL